MDDAYLNGYARLCGWKATLVYMSLCRHASKDQFCFPSIKLMSEEHRVSRDVIGDGIKVLKDWNIIEVGQRKGSHGLWKNNTYTLLDKSVWQQKPTREANSLAADGKAVNPLPHRYTPHDGQAVAPTKETQREGNTYNDLRTTKMPSAHQQFIEFFSETAQRTRRVKPIITKVDEKNLKRMIDMGYVSQNELEQVALYFLGSRHYLQFSPSISVFLSAGLLTGLLNQMKNNETEFWQTVDNLAVKQKRHYGKAGTDLAERITCLKERFKFKK